MPLSGSPTMNFIAAVDHHRLIALMSKSQSLSLLRFHNVTVTAHSLSSRIVAHGPEAEYSRCTQVSSPIIALLDAQVASAGAEAPAVDVARALRTAAARVLCNSEAAGLLYDRRTSPPKPGTYSCLRHTITAQYYCTCMLVAKM